MKHPGQAAALVTDTADVQGSADHRRVPIDRVGIRSIRHPLRVADRSGVVQHTVARLNMYVSLPHHQKGTHMSRFVAILGEHDDVLTVRGLNTLMQRMTSRLEADSGHLEVAFPYFVNKAAPISGVRSLMDYEVTLTGVSTGFTDLDTLLTGLKRSDLMIVGARPSVGKSSFALGIARNAAIMQKANVAVFSLEMSAEQLAIRLLSAESGVDSSRLRLGQNTEIEERRVVGAAARLSEANIWFDDSPMLTAAELRAKARRLAGESRRLDLIIIDYLQLMQGETSGGRENRVQEISYISRTLKGLARELDVPIIALAQLSRAIENRHPRTPMLSDLRDSGSIEQDADIVMFLSREELYTTPEQWAQQHPDLPESAYPKGVAQVIVAKHRNGPTGTVELRFRERLAKFEDWVLRTDDIRD